MRGAISAGWGLVWGLPCAALLTRFMADLVFEVSPVDPITYLAVATIMTLVSLAASLIPALRATHIDPARAINAS